MGIMWPSKVAIFVAIISLLHIVGAQDGVVVNIGGVNVQPGGQPSSTSSSSTSTSTTSTPSSSSSSSPSSTHRNPRLHFEAGIDFGTESTSSTGSSSTGTSSSAPSSTATSSSTVTTASTSTPSSSPSSHSTESSTTSTSTPSSSPSSHSSTESSTISTSTSTESTSVSSSSSSTATSASSSASASTSASSESTSSSSSESTPSSSNHASSSTASSSENSTSAINSSSSEQSIATALPENSTSIEQSTSSGLSTLIFNTSETENVSISTNASSTMEITESATEQSIATTRPENSTSIEQSTSSGLSTVIFNTSEAENVSMSANTSSTMEITEPATSTVTLGSTSVSVNGSTEGETMRPGPGGHPPVLSDYDCSSVDPGYYGNPKVPCDTKFYICVDRSMFAYEQRCPAKLYYDAEMKICDMWAHIPDCSGKSRPPVVVTNETEFTLSPVPSVIDCYNVSDGNYPDPESTPKPYCSNRFFTCAGRREFRFYCPRGLFYDHERNQCDLYERVFVCSGKRVLNETELGPQPTFPPANYNCGGKLDGYYADKCDSVYYSCNGGVAREFRCPEGLVFDSEWLACEAPHDTLVCTGTRRPSTARPPSTVPHTVEITTASPLNCRGQKDDIYRDPQAKCSRIFYYCAHDVTFRNLCPGNLYFDAEFKRCDLWINIFDCSGVRPTSTLKPSTVAPSVLPAVDFDCSKIDDGNYVNPKNNCSQFFYICANMEAFQQYCPASLYYDPDLNNCNSWSNIFACSGISQKPSVATLPVTAGTTQKPEFDCSLKSDGVYTNAVNACSGVYFRCSGGNAFKFNCPGGLFYDTTVDRCDIYDYVFACSGLTRPPTTSPVSTTRGSTVKPPIDCRALADGDYADPSAKNKCGHFFYTCSSGSALRRECADGTYYDVDLHVCDVFWNIPACTGKPRPSTNIPTTRGPTGPPPPFDCTKLHDGNYPAANCTGDFWSCVGGTTFPRKCPMGFVYDDEFNDCEFRNMVPKCGGNRITTASKVDTSPTTPPGGFKCNFLPDGNYADPATKCSTIYYTCANGMTTRVHCQAGLYYDIAGNLCNSHDLVPACNGGISVQNSTASEAISTSSSTVVPSSSTAPSTAVPITSSTSTLASSTTTSSSVSSTVSSSTTVPSTSSTPTSTAEPSSSSSTTTIGTTSSSTLTSTPSTTVSSSTSTPSTTISSSTASSTPSSTIEVTTTSTAAPTEVILNTESSTSSTSIPSTSPSSTASTTTHASARNRTQILVNTEIVFHTAIIEVPDTTSQLPVSESTIASTEKPAVTSSSAILGLTSESTAAPQVNNTTPEKPVTQAIHHR